MGFLKQKDKGPAAKEITQKIDQEGTLWEALRQDDGVDEGGLGNRIADLSQKLEKFNLAEYMNYLNSPRRYMMFNFMAGLFRGFGMVLGVTILGALVLYVLQRLVVLKLPVIGDFIAELIRIVLTYL